MPEPNTGCWIWTGYLDYHGYGSFYVRKRSWGAHRIAYELYRGSIPEGLFACHKCDNTWCVNPDHLFIGDVRDNTIDMYRKGRGNNPHGSKHWNCKFTDDEVRTIRTEYARGVKQKDIAARFNTIQQTVSEIVNLKKRKRLIT